MVEIITQHPLIIQLYLLLVASPRLAGAIALFISIVVGGVIIWALHRQRGPKVCDNMAEGFSDSSQPVGSGRVKTPSTLTVTPVTPVIGPVTPTSSSSASSSDILLPENISLEIGSNHARRMSSWPRLTPIPWRSSWGFLEQYEQRAVVVENEEDTDTRKVQSQEPQPQPQPQQQVEDVPSNSVKEGNYQNNNTIDIDLLMLPTTGTTPVRRTGSMEARKGSACSSSRSLVAINGSQGLGLGVVSNDASLENGNGNEGNEQVNDDGGSGPGSDLIGVGGQFQFY